MTPNLEHKTPYPKILLAVFLAILAIIGFGIGQAIYSPKASGGNSLSSIGDLIKVNFTQIPVAKDKNAKANILANNYILLDAESKVTMTARGARDRVPIASITKVMTAIITIENADMKKVVTIEQSDVDVTGSKIGLVKGEQITIENLLNGLMVKSGNDCAQALSRAVFGNQNNFIEKMNQKAKGLRLTDTKYLDPHGLSQEAYSSAYDQAILFSYALKNQKFKKLIGTSEVEIASTDNRYKHKIENSNRLVTQEMHFSGIIGGKTGFTFEAGHSLVSAAQRDDHTLISVILKTKASTNEASAEETSKLLSWGFDNFTWQ